MRSPLDFEFSPQVRPSRVFISARARTLRGGTSFAALVQPALVVLALREPVNLIDLRGSFATRLGASTAMHSGPRSRARAWARDIYEAYPDAQGLYYGSSMNGHAPAVVLTERATSAIPEQPLFIRALNDDLILETLQQIALRLSYGLR